MSCPESWFPTVSAILSFISPASSSVFPESWMRMIQISPLEPDSQQSLTSYDSL